MRLIERFVCLLAFTVIANQPLFSQIEGAIHGAVFAEADRSVLLDATIRLDGGSLLGPVSEESSFAARQYSMPRQLSGSVWFRF